MQKSARTAQTIRPLRSGSSTMQPATGQAAWQIEQANAPKQASGSMTAIVLGAFLRGPPIIFVHIVNGIISWMGLRPRNRLGRRLLNWPTAGSFAVFGHRRPE